MAFAKVFHVMIYRKWNYWSVDWLFDDRKQFTYMVVYTHICFDKTNKTLEWIFEGGFTEQKTKFWNEGSKYHVHTPGFGLMCKFQNDEGCYYGLSVVNMD